MTRSTTAASAPARPETVGVIKLERPAQLEPSVGRPRTLKAPALPQDILDGMTELEREHFKFFIEAYKRDYQIKKPSDLIALQQAALEYINLLRVQAQQLKSGQVITAARQHPGVQMRAWLSEMGATRSKRKPDAEEDDEQKEMKEFIRRLSAPSPRAA